MTNPTPTTRAPLPATDENLLKSAPPPAFKPTGTSVEMRALEQTLALLNNTNITGARLPAEEAAAAKAIVQSAAAPAASTPAAALPGVGQSPSPARPVTPENDPGETLSFPDPIHTPDPLQAAPTPAASAASPVAGIQRIVLTGRSGVGKDYLAGLIPGAHVLNLDTPIWSMVREQFPDGPASGLFSAVQTIKAWGDGVVSDKYPITPARMLFIQSTRDLRPGWENFGKLGFWVDRVLDFVNRVEGQVIVTGVETAQEFAKLAEASFRHYHVVCSSATYIKRAKRPGANDSFTAALDQNVTKEISQNRVGRVLRCVWCDSVTPSPSGRIMSIAQWRTEVEIKQTIETGE